MEQQEYYRNFTVPIMCGDVDEFLDSIILAVQQRRKDMAPKIWEYRVGDAVKLVNTNPKYLNGVTATVRKINRTKVVIDLDKPQGRFYNNISVPLTMIEKV